MYLGGVLTTRIRLIIRLLVIAEDPCEDIVRETFNRQIITVDLLIEIATRNIDPVLSAFDLCLEVFELLGGLQVRIALCNCHQPAERALQLSLSPLISSKRRRVVDVYLYLGGIGAGIDDFLQRRFFEVGRTFDDLDNAIV